MDSKRTRNIAVIAAVFTTIILSACATPQGPILVETAAYVAPPALAATATKVVVGISPFQDARGKKTSVVGERVNEQGQFQNDLVIQGNVADLVTAALRKALEVRKIAVKEVPSWDMKIEDLKADGVDVVIGGSITSLWAKTTAQTLNVTTKAEVSLKALAADAKEKKLIRVVNLNGSYERQDLTFDTDKIGEAIAAALSQTIDQLMNDEELKKKLQ